VVHRDIAARNFLVYQINGRYGVKISDFGMSREADQDYYKTSNYQLPVRWCAPEVLTNRKFSSASDIWSFGVAIWEVLTLGQLPYYWLNNKDITGKIVDDHEKLKRPAQCPDELWSILELCFDDDPDLRPTFEHVLHSLNDINAKHNYVGVNNTDPSDISKTDNGEFYK